MIAVIDYDTGNLRSVANALGRLGAEYRITASPDEIRSAERVLLPGVGEEGDAECIGIFDNEVRKFTAEGLKVPHMGWNSIGNLRSPLLDGIAEGSYVYYVHSYAPTVNGDTIATTVYGETFSGAINRGNFFGTQFHPEKSASVGERILQNFLTL